MPYPEAFQILHYDSALKANTLHIASNALSNPGFETNDWTGYATHSNWSEAASASQTPAALDAYCALAASAAGDSSVLETNRYGVTPGAAYVASLLYGVAAGRTSNTLTVQIKWWAAASGGSPVKTDKLIGKAITGDSARYKEIQSRHVAPASANYASLYVKNKHSGTGTPALWVDNLFFAAEVISGTPQLLERVAHLKLEPGRGHHNLRFSTHFRAGFKESTFDLWGDPAWLEWWMDYCLGHHVEIHFDVSDPFVGLVWSMEGRINGRPRRRSLDDVVNHVHFDYGKFGAPTYGSRGINFEDAPSIARYGRIQEFFKDPDAVLSDATARSRLVLDNFADPPASDDFSTGYGGDNQLTITVSGYFATLAFLYASMSLGKITADTSALIATRADSALNTVFRKGNTFISNDYSRVQTTGVNGGPRNVTESVTGGKFIDMITTWLKMGALVSGKYVPVVSGVWENRQFVLRPFATSFEYIQDVNEQGKTIYRDAGGQLVPNPLVRAGTVVRAARLVPTTRSYSGVNLFLDPSIKLFSEVEYDAERDEVSPSTPQAKSLDLLIAKVPVLSEE